MKIGLMCPVAAMDMPSIAARMRMMPDCADEGQMLLLRPSRAEAAPRRPYPAGALPPMIRTRSAFVCLAMRSKALPQEMRVHPLLLFVLRRLR